ncbi:pentapeptide repeat-containing protein [Novosphingobium aquae]|uniref:Pentapeptide repeat-containing protein n=1 Tax=Novosphingobium aquae TaxID=3133435 RepID=A0ABU8S871_9SPHN
MTIDLQPAIDAIKQSRGKRIPDRLIALGLDPATDFAGGDWRYSDFRNCDLAGFDFRNARLFGADFTRADVSGTDFTGALDVHKARLHLASNWQDAILTDDQIVLIETQISGLDTRRRTSLAPQQWVALIRDASDYNAAAALLDEMDATSNALNAFAYTATIMKARSLEDRADARRRVDEFLAKQGEPDVAFFTEAMSLAINAEQANKLFADMKRRRLFPDKYAYNKLISKQEKFDKALPIYQQMIDNSIEINEYTGYALFDVIANFDHAITVLIKMRENGVFVFTYQFMNELVKQSRLIESTTRRVQELIDLGKNPREIVRTLIIEKAKDPWRSTALQSLGLDPLPDLWSIGKQPPG